MTEFLNARPNDPNDSWIDLCPEELLYQAQNDDIIGRGWAVRDFGRFPVVPEVEGVLTELVADDPFWAVRVAASEKGKISSSAIESTNPTL